MASWEADAGRIERLEDEAILNNEAIVLTSQGGRRMAEGRIKPKIRSAAERMPKPPPPLDEGDWIEYGNTVEVKTRNVTAWPKIACGTKIRPGESPEDALSRIVEFVSANLSEQVENLT